MATDLPEKPESREESYLADIAGQEVVLPEKPLSRKEQYLAYIAENGGGGGGGTNNFNQLTNRPKYNGTTMTGDTNIPEVKTYTAGTNVTISGTTISATDTTYSDFTGTDGTSAGAAGLVPAPATTDAGKFLKADGTWDTAGGGGVTVVQTPGSSTTDVMSQNATASMVFADPDNQTKVKIGAHTSTSEGSNAVEIGNYSKAEAISAVAIGGGNNATQSAGAYGQYSVAIGGGSKARNNHDIAIGGFAEVGENHTGSIAIGGLASNAGADSYKGAIALGYGARASETGLMSIGVHSSTQDGTDYGYNNTLYRLLTGLYDGQDAHDAATYGQVISYSAINGAGAPTTATEGKYVGQLYYDTTNEAMYFLKAIDTTTTPPTYTWEALGGGGSQYNIYSTKTTSNSDTGGAIYLGNLGTNQAQAVDPTTTDNHYKYFWALPQFNTSYIPTDLSVNIMGNVRGYAGIAIGSNCNVGGGSSVGIGYSVTDNSNAEGAVCLGSNSRLGGKGTITLGAFTNGSTTQGVMKIGPNSTSYGYNNSNYRLITGVYDGQGAHDAATVGQITPLSDSTAPTTATVGTLGKIYIDTSTTTAYMCVEADDVTPSYTWKQITA